MPIKRAEQIIDSTRRQFLRQGFAGVGWVMAGGTLSRCSSSDGEMSSPAMSNIANLGPLLDPDENGLRLPAGFSSRVIARSGTAGELQAAEVLGDGPEGAVEWRTVPDPSGVSEETRYQVPASTEFDGGK